jgi:hypothetical protein
MKARSMWLVSLLIASIFTWLTVEFVHTSGKKEVPGPSPYWRNVTQPVDGRLAVGGAQYQLELPEPLTEINDAALLSLVERDIENLAARIFELRLGDDGRILVMPRVLGISAPQKIRILGESTDKSTATLTQDAVNAYAEILGQDQNRLQAFEQLGRLLGDLEALPLHSDARKALIRKKLMPGVLFVPASDTISIDANATDLAGRHFFVPSALGVTEASEPMFQYCCQVAVATESFAPGDTLTSLMFVRADGQWLIAL